MVAGASSDRQRARVLVGVKARRSAPPPLRGAHGLDAGSAHARPDWLLQTMPNPDPLHVVVDELRRIRRIRVAVDRMGGMSLTAVVSVRTAGDPTAAVPFLR